MKILYVLDTYTLGGAEKMALLEANEMSKNYKDTTLLVSRNYDELCKVAKCKIVHIDRNKKYDLKYIKHLKQYILENNYTHIHFHSCISLFHFIFTLLWLTNIKIFYTHHGFIDKKNPKGRFDIKLLFINIVASIFVSVNIAVSKFQLNDLNKYGITKLKLLYNFADEKYCYLNKTLKLCEKEKIICGMTGNINKARDHMTVVRACKILLDRGYYVEMWFAGKGVIGTVQVQDEIRLLNLESRIKLLGAVDNIPKFLAEIDIFIASSKYETFGIGMLESLAVGVPTLASDIPVYKEVTNNGEYACLFKCGDEYDLADKFESLINDKKYLANMEMISSVIRDKYSIDNHIRGLMNIYNS